MQDNTPQNWNESGIRNQVVFDPFLMPAKDGIAQNLNFKSEWISFHFNKNCTLRNNTALPKTVEIQLETGTSTRYKTVPVFILNNALRI